MVVASSKAARADSFLSGTELSAAGLGVIPVLVKACNALQLGHSDVLHPDPPFLSLHPARRKASPGSQRPLVPAALPPKEPNASQIRNVPQNDTRDPCMV
ncbi:unnamed protein product [Symbiodinium natans]|uniref:Uncharacterized protein n=1 Tax=Symbiodinium natans TaxID=878477 RepID=A0A812IKB1_9DINO|nr:unnamed protein product [Symbiodinium natans]